MVSLSNNPKLLTKQAFSIGRWIRRVVSEKPNIVVLQRTIRITGYGPPSLFPQVVLLGNMCAL